MCVTQPPLITLTLLLLLHPVNSDMAMIDNSVTIIFFRINALLTFNFNKF